jgi:hypothetical protein
MLHVAAWVVPCAATQVVGAAGGGAVQLVQSVMMAFCPGARILKQAQPGARAVGCQTQLLGDPGLLPPQVAALRVGHQRQVPPV